VFICASGDIHGAMDRLYQDVFKFEAALGVRFDYVLHVGDFGVPDPSRIDKATRHHDGAGDFPVWLEENRGVPRPTAFIKGNNEDFAWLDAQDTEVLPGLTYLRMDTRSISRIRVRAVCAWVVSAVVMVRRTICAVPTGFKVTPSDTTRQTRLNGSRTQAAWILC
jgi:hypothetical protein